MGASPKRILVFSIAYYPFVGGVEVALKEITDRISPQEIEFHVLTLRIDSRLPKEEQIGNVVVHRIGFGRPGARAPELTTFPLRLNIYFYELFAGLIALSLHWRYRFTAVWAMMAHTAGIPAAIFKTFYGRVPYLLTLQEGDPPEYIERLMRPVWPLFVRGFTKADYLQSISSFLDRWGKRMGFKGEALVIPNGVDTARFTKEHDPAVLEGYRRKLNKQASDIFLVTTSRLVYKNAIDDVIRALPLLPDNVSFIVYGIGPDEPKLRALTKELGLTERVRFMGQIGHEEMPIALKACDIFVRPSRSEGMGNSFVEAMAAGLPVIATQEGGIADFLFDAEQNPGRPATGFAVHKDAPEEIAAAVKRILDNPEEVRKTTEVARALAIERYDWGLIAGEMRSLFERIVK